MKLVALRNDAPGLALRGIAMAQLGEHARARELLRSATRAFSPREAVAKARCIVAEAEIALVSRDLKWTAKTLDAARVTLEKHGDRANAAHARYLEIRRLLLIGKLDEAERALTNVPASVPLALKIAHELIVAGIAMRRLHTKERARRWRAPSARRTAPAFRRSPPKSKARSSVLNTPAARLIAKGKERLLLLDEVEAMLASKALIVDGCRHVVRHGMTSIRLAKRPVLLTLARALAEAWPERCAARRARRARVPIEAGG